MWNPKTYSPLSKILLLCIGAWLTITPLAAAEPNPTIRVEVAQVDNTPVGATKQATGVVSAYRTATVAAERRGRIVERLVEPGTVTKPKQTLVQIDTANADLALKQSRAMAMARQVDRDHAQHEYQRGKRLFKKNVISQDTLDDLFFAQQGAQAEYEASQVGVATAEKNRQDTIVTAPFSGHIEQVHVHVGDYVNPGQPVVTLTDFSKARVIAGVTSRETTAIQTGDHADVVFDDLGGIALDAVVTNVGRIKNDSNGTYPVELLIASDTVAQQLREGMIANVSWRSRSTPSQRLSIPSAALVRRAGELNVYVVIDNKAQLRRIRIGASDGRRVEVVSGVSEGEWVVVQGQFALRDGAGVAVATQPTGS